MTRQYYLESALLPQGWVRGALVNVADDGYISAIDVPTAIEAPASGNFPPETALASESIAGIVVPGMANAHSHAFQRGMAGNTE